MTCYADTILPPREGNGLPRWTLAALVVLAIHLAVGACIILARRSDIPTGAPTNAVMIDLAPVATAPSLPQPLTAPPPPAPALQTVPETPPVMAAPPSATLPVPPILQTPDRPPAPKPEAVPPRSRTVPGKTFEQNRIEKQRRVEHERLRKQKTAERQRKQHAAASARAAGPPPGAARQSMSSWASQVQARINAAKRYPEAARARRESGTATLAFTVDARGRIVSASIASSSGSSALDSATLSMAHRLGRLPPPPNGRVTLRVRVSFSMR